MTFTEVTNQSWIGRLGNAIVGVLVGIVLVPVAAVVLFWNEGRAVHTSRTLEEGQASVVTVSPIKIDPVNDGKLIHFTGKAVNAGNDKLVDSKFNVSVDAIHLHRRVLMYEWVEDKKEETRNNTLGGGSSTKTTYNYFKTWKDHPIDSSNFKHPNRHENPSQWRIEETTVDAPKVTAGAFTLNAALVGKIDNFTAVDMPANSVDQLSADLKDDSVFSNNAVYIANDTGRKPDPESPQVGDIKVAFEAALPGDVSVIAQQQGPALSPYQTKNNALQLLYTGNHSSDEMFQSEQTKNTHITWLLRLVGFVVMWVGLAMVLNPLRIAASVIGVIGEIVGVGAAILAGMVAVAISSLVIAIAWIAYRPLIGIGMLIIAGGAITLILVLRRNAASRHAAGGALVTR